MKKSVKMKPQTQLQPFSIDWILYFYLWIIISWEDFFAHILSKPLSINKTTEFSSIKRHCHIFHVTFSPAKAASARMLWTLISFSDIRTVFLSSYLTTPMVFRLSWLKSCGFLVQNGRREAEQVSISCHFFVVIVDKKHYSDKAWTNKP